MLSDVYDALVCAFKAYGCDVPLYLGKQFIDQHTEPLRVVIWQDADTFAPQQASVLQGQTGYNAQGFNPRPVATRTCGAVASLWASSPPQKDPSLQFRSDLALLDALINQVVIALQATVPGLFIVSAGLAADNNDQGARSGLGYELRFTVAVPVIDVPWAPVITHCAQTWREMAATAEVTPAGRVDTSTTPPSYQNPYTFPVPNEE